MRALINYTLAPEYKVAKKLQLVIKRSIKFDNDHSVKTILNI